MKLLPCFGLGATGLLFALLGASLRAEDWTTTDGKAYQQVKVIKVEADAVTILDQDGGARISLDKLPPDLQKRFDYDPVKAKTAADARAVAEIQDAQALQAERAQSNAQKVAADPRYPVATVAISGSPRDVPINSGIDISNDPLTSAPGGPAHYAMSDLVDVHQRLRDADLGPDHHTMGALIYTMHTLASDPFDPNHHSMSDLFSNP